VKCGSRALESGQGIATKVKIFSHLWPSTAVLKKGNGGARGGY
jgi:hypothetical protein